MRCNPYTCDIGYKIIIIIMIICCKNNITLESAVIVIVKSRVYGYEYSCKIIIIDYLENNLTRGL